MSLTASEQLAKLENKFIEKISDNMKAFGVSTTLGRVLGIIYMNREPMTLDDLAVETGMSKTRMSQVMREMTSLHVAERVFRKGVRRDLYSVEEDYYQTFVSIFTSNWQEAITTSKRFERRIRRDLKDVKNLDNLSEADLEKIQELEREVRLWTEYYDWLERIVEFFESGEVFDFVPKKIN